MTYIITRIDDSADGGSDTIEVCELLEAYNASLPIFREFAEETVANVSEDVLSVYEGNDQIRLVHKNSITTYRMVFKPTKSYVYQPIVTGVVPFSESGIIPFNGTRTPILLPAPGWSKNDDLTHT